MGVAYCIRSINKLLLVNRVFFYLSCGEYSEIDLHMINCWQCICEKACQLIQIYITYPRNVVHGSSPYSVTFMWDVSLSHRRRTGWSRLSIKISTELLLAHETSQAWQWSEWKRWVFFSKYFHFQKKDRNIDVGWYSKLVKEYIFCMCTTVANLSPWTSTLWLSEIM